MRYGIGQVGKRGRGGGEGVDLGKNDEDQRLGIRVCCFGLQLYIDFYDYEGMGSTASVLEDDCTVSRNDGMASLVDFLFSAFVLKIRRDMAIIKAPVQVCWLPSLLVDVPGTVTGTG